MAEEQLVEELRDLADELNIRDPAKLLRAAQRREVRDASLRFAQQALAKDVGRQIMRPPPRSLGKSAAEIQTLGSRPIFLIFRRMRGAGLVRGMPCC